MTHTYLSPRFPRNFEIPPHPLEVGSAHRKYLAPYNHHSNHHKHKKNVRKCDRTFFLASWMLFAKNIAWQKVSYSARRQYIQIYLREIVGLLFLLPHHHPDCCSSSICWLSSIHFFPCSGSALPNEIIFRCAILLYLLIPPIIQHNNNMFLLIPHLLKTDHQMFCICLGVW